jgi:2-haloalkanoic acid dehalogenase type II
MWIRLVAETGLPEGGPGKPDPLTAAVAARIVGSIAVNDRGVRVVRALFFDLDGTLQDLDSAFAAAVAEVLAPAAHAAGALGHQVQAELNRHWPPLWAAFAAGALAEADLYPRWIGQACQSLGLAVRPDRARELALRYEAVFEERLGLYPDVRPALDRLLASRADIVLGVITNGPVERQTRRMAALGLDSVFPIRIVSEAVGFWKPDPRLFRHALRRAAVSPWQAVMTGDDPFSDIEGAQSAGMRTIWIDRGGRPWPAELRRPDRQVRSLEEAVDCLLGLEGLL